MPGACPSTEQLAAALRSQQSSAADAELSAHLAECPACQTRLEELAGGSGWLEARAKAHAAPAHPASESLHKAMQALESHSPSPAGDTPSPPQLDFLQPSDQPGLLGRFGPYEVLASVAIGGMGIVLKARDPGLNRIVALKILPPALAANSLARARFIREARAAAAVVHEHVVPIYAVDECAGLPYLVMQFIEGRPLSERIRATGALRLEEILRIGAQTASGLSAAHAQGLIHRDVKPGNILLENGVERVKITDFGLARATDDSSLTREGYIAGTPEYMSPEQARNEPVDQRADLFSLGCVLYEMATGISPFRAEKPLVAMRRVCDEEPTAAHTLNPKVPEWLGQLIQRLMAKTAAARLQTATEVSADLERRLADWQQAGTTCQPHSGPPAATTGRPRPLPWPAWAAVLVLLLALVWFAFLKPKPESAAGNKPALPPAIQTNALFVIPASGDTPAREFAALTAAVAAAEDGSVIECHFNGSQLIETIRVRDKPLVIRAAPGFEPVLTQADSGRPFLISEAGLVLEGLTLLIQSTRPGDGGRGTSSQLNHGIIVEDGPLLVTHCRLGFAPNAPPLERPFPQFASLVNVRVARFFHCEFACGEAFVLEWRLRPDSTPRETIDSLVVLDSTAEGNLLLTNFRGWQALHLDLQRNSFSGQSLLALREPDPGKPLEVQTSDNVFALDMVANSVARAGGVPIERLLRWRGQSNAYSVKNYADSSRSMSHEEWLASSVVSETNSVAIELGIRARLDSLTERSPAAEAAAFTLTPEERQRLKAQGWTSDKSPGADPQKTGPGQPYHEWRNSPDYAEWLKLVREHLPQSAASP
jgi:tRNA A-37 threonylcarbamoyl transferase component Bud32